MTIPFIPWPQALADSYEAKGYWQNLPLTDILLRQLENKKDHVCLISQNEKYTYFEVDQFSTRTAKKLSTLGVKAGDTAVVQLPNIADFYIVFFALLKLGVVPVNALYSHNKIELEAYIDQISPSLLVVSGSHSLFKFEDYSLTLKSDFPSIKHVLVHGESAFGTPLRSFYDVALGCTEPPIDFYTPTAPDQVAFFQLSGGTTGIPKLIPRTHNDYYYSVRASAEVCHLDAFTRYLCALPAPHNFSLSSPGALGVFYAGGSVVLAPDPSPDTCFKLIEQHSVTMTALVPPAAILWLQAKASSPFSIESLKLLQVGGARLSEAVARQVSEILGCKLQQVFGMAEGLVNYTRLDDDDYLVQTTQGCPLSEADEIKVVDKDGQPVSPGEVGALMTRGPYTFRGYFNSPQHNAQVIDDEGFYRSGDLVEQVNGHYLRVVGRDKDQINRGGEKIAAEEIENLLLTHEAISNAALVSMPDAIMGEKSCAFLVLKPEASPVKPLLLRKYIRLRGVADYKIPDRFEYLTEFPLTPIGKVDKGTLRQLIQSKFNLQK